MHVQNRKSCFADDIAAVCLGHKAAGHFTYQSESLLWVCLLVSVLLGA
jgi:hypothetical protein